MKREVQLAKSVFIFCYSCKTNTKFILVGILKETPYLCKYRCCECGMHEFLHTSDKKIIK
jgi:hypothetical protein